MLLDDGNVVDIIYLDAYERLGLIKIELSPATSPLYGFTRDHVILRGTVKLLVIVGEHPKVLTIVTEFLIVDCLSVVNGIIGRPHLMVVKVVTSIYNLTMKFSAIERMGQVQGSQYNLRECYNKSLRVAEKERKLPQKME